MADSNKRKINKLEDTAVVREVYGDRVVDPFPKRRRKNVTAQPSENLMMKLPGELRNRIYDLVTSRREGPFLAGGCTSFVRATRLPHNTRMKVAGQYTTRPWREPALLHVSNQIRQEAMSIYYGKRTFNICLKSDELKHAYDFLFSKSTKSGKRDTYRIDVSFVLHLIKPHWSEVCEWFDLARIVSTSKHFDSQCMVIHGFPMVKNSVCKALDGVVAMAKRTPQGSSAALQKAFSKWGRSQHAWRNATSSTTTNSIGSKGQTALQKGGARQSVLKRKL